MKKRHTVKIGEIYGRLTVSAEVPVRSKFGSKQFVCKCSCNNKTLIVVGSALRGEKGTKSCGCLQKLAVAVVGRQNRKKPQETTYNSLERPYKRRAKEKNFIWALTKADFRTIISKDCFWCGEPPRRQNKYFSVTGLKHSFYKNINMEWAEQQWITANGIDRKDSSKGYTLVNSVPCCVRCNEMKSDYSESDFLNKVQQIASFQKDKHE